MASSLSEEEEAFKHTLLVVHDEVSLYKIPPRTTTGGYKCNKVKGE
jgi:adaptin ear-binding coat-associated protein 1/2